MKKLLSIASILVVGAAFNLGCSSDDNNNNPATTDSGTGDSVVTTDSGKGDSVTTDSPTTDSGGGDTPGDSGPPGPPTLGTQIDRMGRPAINTALNHPFDTTAATKGAAKDAYNQDKDPTNWVKATTYIPEFMANLGILDALDGTCGNQLAYKGTTPAADSYSTLAAVLAGDMLWLKTDAPTCTLNDSPNLPTGGYLAVEANALGFTNTDCGGRAPSYDVMNVSLGLLAVGAGGIGSHLDGIATVPDRTKGTTFPYLAAPH